MIDSLQFIYIKYRSSRFCSWKTKISTIPWLIVPIYILVGMMLFRYMNREYYHQTILIMAYLVTAFAFLLTLQFLIVYIYITIKIYFLRKRSGRKMNYKFLSSFLLVLTFIISYSSVVVIST